MPNVHICPLGQAMLRCAPQQPFMGSVSTRACLNTSFVTLSSGQATTTYHYARDILSQVKVAFGNWSVVANQGPFVEAGTGNALTVSMSITYPTSGGTTTNLLFGGASSISVPNTTTQWSDLTTLAAPIPNGALFAVTMTFSGASGAVPFCQAAPATALSEPNGYFAPVYPLAIVGRTTIPSICVVGDSRQAGIGDTVMDASGNAGEMPRAFGGNFAYSQIACPGEDLASFLTNSTLRQAILQYCTHVIGCHGINDLRESSTAAALLADIITFKGLVGQRPLLWTTLSPVTTSTNNWVDQNGQTPSLPGGDGQRVSFNTSLRGGLSSLVGIVDVCGTTESSLNSGKWITNGTSQFYTTDGLHETTAAYTLIPAQTALPVVNYALYMPQS